MGRHIRKESEVRLVPILSEEDKKREEVIVYLWSLRYPRKYRGKFMGYYNQWRNTKRAGGALEWAAMVFGEYFYPGWGLNLCDRCGEAITS